MNKSVLSFCPTTHLLCYYNNITKCAQKYINDINNNSLINNNSINMNDNNDLNEIKNKIKNNNI